ncbi:MAG: hypothetical protein JWO57_4337 [Pseudonocardiales bacterium]|nr:hypothetical protein [Pseudonocardiales bacterium]
MLAVGAALYGMTYLFTSFIRGVMGDTAIQTAFVFLPVSVVTIVAAQASTKLLPRRRPTSFRRSRRNPSGSRTGHQSYRSEGGLTMLSLQEISDRLEIQDLFVRYAHAVDTCDWDLYRTVFTPDAHIDYTAFGAPAGGVEEIVAFLASVIPDFKSTQHAVANTLLTIDADTARARTICYNPMVRDNDGKDQITIFGLWYHDVLVRTPEGWRITHRSEERSYTLTDGALG